MKSAVCHTSGASLDMTYTVSDIDSGTVCSTRHTQYESLTFTAITMLSGSICFRELLATSPPIVSTQKSKERLLTSHQPSETTNSRLRYTDLPPFPIRVSSIDNVSRLRWSKLGSISKA